MFISSSVPYVLVVGHVFAVEEHGCTGCKRRLRALWLFAGSQRERAGYRRVRPHSRLNGAKELTNNCSKPLRMRKFWG